MLVLSGRSALLFVCMAAAFVVIGRAPGAINLRTREIELSIEAERKPNREKPGAMIWPRDRVSA